ncbi:MAG: phosphotransferase family protein [Candidatus Binataceae bacterium]
MPEPVEITPEYGEVRDEERLEWGKLAAYLRDKLAGADQPLHVLQFRGGHSNLTYLLRFGETEWVMRRPPFGPLPVGGHDMGREYRVLSRLWQAFKPAPRGMLYCEDNSIIGAPFFIMERRRGILFRMREPLPRELGNDPATFRRISEGFIDTLADLHAVDFEQVGLGDLGRPTGFLERQIKGWMQRWERAKTREVPLMERLGAWYLENMPEAQAPTILHNDFYLHNIMLDAQDPGRVVGVFDWEMSTLGDPMIDLGISLAYWRDRTDPEDLLELSQGVVHTIQPGFFTREELAERYAKKTGRDLSRLGYFRSWAHWKNATVVEQIYARYVRGQTSDPRFAPMSIQAPALAAAAAGVAKELGFRE